MSGPAVEGARASAGDGSSIYDLGYRGYEGPRLGRRAAVWSLVVHSVRTAYGLGRNARAKLVPVGLAAFAILPAIFALGIVVIVSQVGQAGAAIEAISPIRYSSLFPIIATLVMLFCAAQAPELFGRDQRQGVLPLYFSRAISRSDYALARALGLLVSVLLFVLVPQLILLAGRVLAGSDVLASLAVELPSMPAAIGGGLLMAALFSLSASAVAAFTPRRSYATAAIIGVFLVPSIVASLLTELADGPLLAAGVLFSPGDVLDGVNAYLFGVRPDSPAALASGHPGEVFLAAAGAWIAGSVVVLLRRYQGLDR
jgi:ABC-2 type transport system permease protein